MAECCLPSYGGADSVSHCGAKLRWCARCIVCALPSMLRWKQESLVCASVLLTPFRTEAAAHARVPMRSWERQHGSTPRSIVSLASDRSA